MKKFSVKQIAVPSLALFIVCFLVTLLLTLTNTFTQKPIENQEIQKQDSSRKIVLSKACEFKEYPQIEDCYEGLDSNGNIVGYTFITKASGYAGEISVMTGIESDGKISGVSILSQSETPGLGANIQKESFLDQYNDKLADKDISVIKNREPKDSEIEAVTGATISSKAATKAVNQAISNYNKIMTAGGME